jgi:colicin import membrane protein
MREASAREQALVVGLSVAGHAVLLVLLALNLELMPRPPPQPVRLAIQATVVDSKALQRQAAARQREQQQAVERERQAEERKRHAEERQREVERQRQEALRLAEQKRKEQAELARRQEQSRKQEAEKLRLAKLDEQRKEAERQAKETAEAKRKVEEERRKAQDRADLARQMAEEEELQSAAAAGLLDQYAEVIRQKVERNWIRPASARQGLHCVVLVKQIPGGEVVDVRVVECNGDAAVVRSIEAAVFRSSPLPPPPNPSLFDRSLRFEFKPEE